MQAMEQELVQLRRDLESARRFEDDRHATDLREANERLVVSAMEAEAVADSAFSRLDELSRVAGSDALTQTPNRATMFDRIDSALALARRHQARVAVIFVDLDRFKQINDTFGHAMGDVVLGLVARRLEAALRGSDTVGRLGGDEFLVLLSEISLTSDVAAIAAKILESLTEPVESPYIVPGASLGIAIFPQDGEDAATLIRNADTAMYAAKRRGGGCFEFCRHLVVDEPAPRALCGDDEAPSRDMSSHAVLRELGNLREANQRLVIAALAAQEAQATSADIQERHSKFVSMVAHELRGPLAPLRTCADLLLSARLGEQGLAKIQAIVVRQVDHLTRIVDDLLEGARANEGKFHLQRRVLALAPIIDAAVETCQPSMTGRGQRFNRRGPVPDESLLVDGDAVRLVQVVGNLLDNASKYTPRGGAITLAVSATAQEIRLIVADDGIGIAADVLPRVFDLFVQDPRAVDVHAGGLGIGLAVVREIVQAHGGRVSAQSGGVGLGSTFEVMLPRKG